MGAAHYGHSLARQATLWTDQSGPRALSGLIEPFDRDDFTSWLGAHRTAMRGIGEDVQRRLEAKAPGLRWGKSAPRVRCGRRADARFA